MNLEERKQKILDLMKDEDYVPLKAKEIAMIMRVPKKEYNEFLEVLGELELELKIQKNRKTLLRAANNLSPKLERSKIQRHLNTGYFILE